MLLYYISPKIPANVFRRFFMVSSASSVRAALREPWRAKPPRPPAEAGAGTAPGAELLAVLGAAEADDTDDDWEAIMCFQFNFSCFYYFLLFLWYRGNKFVLI